MAPVDLTGKVVIVTGGNTGIGRVTALEIARLGAEVLILARNKVTCESAVAEIKEVTKNEKVTHHIVDLASFASIRDFATSFLSSYNQLDILINNAGLVSPPFDVTEENIEAHVGVNYLGHFYLTRLLSDMLVKCRSKVVVLSSRAHEQGEIKLGDLEGEVPGIFCPPKERSATLDWKRYSISNRARVYFARELIVRHPELTAVSLHPGVIKTELDRGMGACVRRITSCLSCLMKTPVQGAATTIHCATNDMSAHNGKYFMDSAPSPLKSGAIIPDVQVKLWDVSVAVCDRFEK